tara:strand:+ start:894 stop:1037 length:144 start_codon:yes stop_codon:yes gene_type:complete
MVMGVALENAERLNGEEIPFWVSLACDETRPQSTSPPRHNLSSITGL